jgi:DNA-binding NarL/FixJ family response regulator
MPARRTALIRHMLLYGAALGLLALIAALIEERLQLGGGAARWSGLAVAVLFAALGVWLGRQLVPRPRSVPFARNMTAVQSLAISPRELEVLDQLVEGTANKVIARRLGISPNTVKTHLARLFEKLGAANRTEAIAKARALEIVR